MDEEKEEDMDVSSIPPPTAADELLDIERQFSNLQTNDKEVLVRQLQRLIGPGVNSYAANFFLDMNNWNLPQAVGSYFDLIGPSNIPPQPQQHTKGSTSAYSSELQSPIALTLPLHTHTPHTLQIRNNGGQPWPSTSLTFISGNNCVVTSEDEVEVVESLLVGGVVEPGATVELKLTLYPLLPVTEMHWQLVTSDGYLFGQLLNIRIHSLDIDNVQNDFGKLMN